MMNRIILTFSILLHSLAIFAQQPEQRIFNATIVAGFNASQIDGDFTAGYHKAGLNIGARAGIILSPRWETGFEILFSQQGAQLPFIKGISRDFVCHLNYIEVPLLIHYKDWEVVNENNETYNRFLFGIGLSYNRLMGGRIEDYRAGGSFEYARGGELFDISAPFKKNHVMLMADVNFFFTKNWGINLRYQRAPMNIREQMRYNPHMIVFRGLFTF